MLTFFVSFIACVAAGALTARAVVRREFERRDAEQARKPPVPVPMPAPAAAAPVAAAPVAVPMPVPVAAPAPPEELSPEILTVLTAAVAAFLGKRARIRSVRPKTASADAWAQQGRVFVQASHNLQMHR
jgi:methylmalonyl-CoA carboxyltransferase large subunit